MRLDIHFSQFWPTVSVNPDYFTLHDSTRQLTVVHIDVPTSYGDQVREFLRKQHYVIESSAVFKMLLNKLRTFQ